MLEGVKGLAVPVWLVPFSFAMARDARQGGSLERNQVGKGGVHDPY